MGLNNRNSVETEELAQLKVMVEQLAEKVSSQQTEIQQLRHQVSYYEEANQAQLKRQNDQITSRRRMLKRLGVAAAGLAVAGTAVVTETRTAEAASDLSNTNTVNSTAIVRPSTIITLPTMEVDADQSGSVLNVTRTKAAALLATANNPNTDTNTDYGIIAVAGPADVNASDLTISAPVGNTFSLKSAAIQARGGAGNPDTNGNIGIHAISSSQVGVVGQYQAISTVANSYFINDNSNLIPAGVVGASDNGIGVIGASSSFSGVYGASSSNLGYSVIACRGAHDVNGNLVGRNLAPLYIEPSDLSGAPTDSGHRKGEMHVDADGKVWICAQTGSVGAPLVLPGRTPPPEFKRVAPSVGVASPGVFYQLTSTVFLNTPVRVVGRNATFSNGTVAYADFPPIAANNVPSYFMIEGSWGTAGNPLVIPSGANGVIGFFTVVGTTGVGFATVFPADATRPVVATVNYGTGATITTSFTARLGVMPNTGTLYPQGVNTSGKKGLAVSSLAACNIAIEIVAYII